MDENERPDSVGEVVTPAEEGSAEQQVGGPAPPRPAGAPTPRESPRPSREEEQSRFIADDAREFARRFPEADLAGLDASESFRRFCGSRYGREPLSELYADYLEVAGGALRAAQARGESRAARSTGSGGSGSYEALNARQQSELDAWNRACPQMKMSAREYLSRNKGMRKEKKP